MSAANQMITFTMENGSVVTLRASGTEPKIKYYIELRTPPGVDIVGLEEARKELRVLEEEVIDGFIQPKKYGLSREH